MTSSIEVFYENQKVGQVQASQAGVPEFAYANSWRMRQSAFPVSFSMPLNEERHAGAAIMPWLANLLPEVHLTQIGQMVGASPSDVLGILSRMGRDTAGALSIGKARGTSERVVPVGSEADLERILDQLPERPFLVGEEGVSMSLAGAQDKLAVSIKDGGIAIPVDGTPSTHVLKPDIQRLRGSVQNEAFCLTLAKMVGLDAANVTTGVAGKRSYLLVERYDRNVGRDGKVRRVHQEDFCQILGFYPSQKYEEPPGGTLVGRGPSLKQMFGALGTHVSPGSRLALLDGVIFNVLTCNVDSHAKNYSVMIGAGGTAKLAPFYDIMCGETWPSITKRMAQKVGTRSEGVFVNAADWQGMAKECGLSPAATLKRVRELAALVQQHVPAARQAVMDMPAGGNQILDQTAHLVLKRTKRIAAQLGPVTTPAAEPPAPDVGTPSHASEDEAVPMGPKGP